MVVHLLFVDTRVRYCRHQVVLQGLTMTQQLNTAGDLKILSVRSQKMGRMRTLKPALMATYGIALCWHNTRKRG